MVTDPRTPVLVGAGQLSGDGTATTPLALSAVAADAALRDAGTGIADRIDTVGFVSSMSWPVRNPARQLADSIGLYPATTLATHVGGTSPLELLADGCESIRAGRCEAMLLAGAEALRSFRAGHYDPGSQPDGTTAPDRVIGSDRNGVGAAAEAAGILQPVEVYPLFENALRASAGRSRAEHERRIAALWQRFAEVAKTNQHAWVTDGATVESILDTSGGNRPIAYPYRKLLTANIFVDQAAAVVLCSAGTAAAAGIPQENWAFVRSTAAAHDHWFLGERDRLDRSPAVSAIADRLLSDGDPAIDEVAHLDLYSCFPSAVQVAAVECGIDVADDPRVPTVTGGLTFAGGPGNNYVTHSLATMIETLRGTAHAHGMVTGVGWYLTKHAAAVLSTNPPETPYRHENPQSDVDVLPGRTVADGFAGEATVETYTVTHDRDGNPERALACCLTGDGSRVLVSSAEPEVTAAMVETDPLGARVDVDGAELLLRREGP